MEKEMFESKSNLINSIKHEIFSIGQSIIYSWETTNQKKVEEKIYDVNLLKLIKEKNEIDIKISNSISGYLGKLPEHLSNSNKRQFKKANRIYLFYKLVLILLVVPLALVYIFFSPIAIFLYLDSVVNLDWFASLLKFILIIIAYPLFFYFLVFRGLKKFEKDLLQYKEIVKEYHNRTI